MSELLSMYGREYYGDAPVLAKWHEFTGSNWMDYATEAGELRQFLLRIHRDIAPDEVEPMSEAVKRMKKGGHTYDRGIIEVLD